jgi:hypothetical protein
MNISPNTVKAFVPTRAGIVAKLLEHNGNGNRYGPGVGQTIGFRRLPGC